MTESVITKIQSLPSGDCVVVEEFPGSGGTLRVLQHDHYRWLQFDDANIQSIVDMNEPARLLSPTCILMLMGFAFTTARDRLLNLGLGGGAIERSVRAGYPDFHVESVELDSRVIEAAKKFFFLPNEQIVHEHEAEHFMSECSSAYDLVMADLFFEERSADCVGHGDFFRHIERCLSPGGVCVMNLLHTDQATLVNTLKAARDYLPVTWLVEVKGHQNVIAYFKREPPDSESGLQSACENVLSELNAVTLDFDWQLVTLPSRL